MSDLSARPLTAERWPDLERLFGPSGAYSNCWCAFQRVTGREFGAGCANRGAGNRALLRALAGSDTAPGLIAYRAGEPVAWVSVGPRPGFGRILRSPITRLGPDEARDEGIWSIVCFWMPRGERGKGLGRWLLEAAVAHARSAGAHVVEAYPVDTGGRRIPSGGAFTGTWDLFRSAGFVRISERVPGRPLVRLHLAEARG